MQSNLNNRSIRVGNIILAKLNEIFARGSILDHNLINVFVTITKVKVSADLKISHCYAVSSLRGASIDKEKLIDILNEHQKKIRFLVTDKIKLKYSPELRFVYDYTLDKTEEVNYILQSFK